MKIAMSFFPVLSSHVNDPAKNFVYWFENDDFIDFLSFKREKRQVFYDRFVEICIIVALSKELLCTSRQQT